MARTRALDFEEKQRAILDYAAKVLATMGVDKASMSQIAAQAQVSKALLYHYYPSKDALIFAIINAHLQELDAALEKGDDPGLKGPARLRLLVGIVLENYRGADDRHKVQLNASSALTEDQKLVITEVERRIVRRFRRGPARHQPAPRQQGTTLADACHHVALRHDELDVYVVQGWRARQP